MNNKKKILSLLLLTSMLIPYETVQNANLRSFITVAKEENKINVVTYDKATKKSSNTVGELTFVVKSGYPLTEVTRFKSINGVVTNVPTLKKGFYNVTLEENPYYEMADTGVDVQDGKWTFDGEDEENILTITKKKGVEIPESKEDEEAIEKALVVNGDKISNIQGLEFEISNGENKEKVIVDKNGSLNIKVKENKDYTIKLLSKEKYEMQDISFKCVKGTSDFGTVYKLMKDNKEITSLNITKKQQLPEKPQLKEQEFTFNVLCGSCGKISIAKELTFMVKDEAEAKEYTSNQGIVDFKLKEGKKYQVSLKKDSDYKMSSIDLEVKKVDGKLVVYSGDKIFKDFVMTKISNTECVETLCDFSDKQVTMAEIPVKVNENGLLRDLKSDEEIIFDLYDTTRSEPVGEVKTVNGKIPALKVYEKDDYILFTSPKNKKFIMSDTPFQKEVSELYFMSRGEGKLPIRHKTKNPYAKGAKLDINHLEVRALKNDEKITKKVTIDYVRIKQDKNNPKDYSKVKFIFTSEYDTITATTLEEDEWGVPLTPLELLENVQYSVRVEDPENKWAIENFPFVLVDKSERGPNSPLGWEGKFPFNHSFCGNAIYLNLVSKGTENKNNTEIICSSGNTTITGMNFRDLKLRTIHPDKSEVANIAELKNKDFDLYRFKLINPKRCEVTKMADGNFTIHRKIKDDKIVEKVYQVNKDKTLTELKFKQNKNIVDIDTKTLSIYDTVIVYKNKNDVDNDNTNPNTNNSNDTTSNDINNNNGNTNNNGSTNNTNTKKEIKFIKGKNQTIKANSNEKLSFEIDANVNDFLKAYVDGVVVDKSMYTVKKGSTIVDFKEEFLNTLKSGQHEFKFEFKQGVAVTNVVIENKKDDEEVNNKNDNKKDEEVNNENDNKKGQNIPKTSIALSTSFTTVALAIAGAFTSLKKRK